MTLAEFAALLQSASVVFAALMAAYGIDAWRREFRYKRQAETAEQVLEAFYKARDVIAQIRSPFGFEGEGTSRKPGKNEKPEHKDPLDGAYVLIERYNQHQDLFAHIRAMRYRVMAQIGEASAQPFDDLNQIVSELIFSARDLARLATVPEWSLRNATAEAAHTERVLKAHNIYYWTGGADDPITPRVEKIVLEVERTCRAIIESRGTLFAVLNLRLWRRDAQPANGADAFVLRTSAPLIGALGVAWTTP